MRTLTAIAILLAALGTGCGDECRPQDHLECLAGSLVWADSCGDYGEVFQTCSCACDPFALTCLDESYTCSGNTIDVCNGGNTHNYACTDVCSASDQCYSGNCSYSTDKGHDVCWCEACTLVTMTLGIRDQCNDGDVMHFRFFDVDHDLVWPDADHVYVAAEYGVDYDKNLSCREGALICFGARAYDGSAYTSGYWGVSIDGSKACDSCCYTCVDGEQHGWNLTCD